MVEAGTARYRVVWREPNPAYVPGPGWIPEEQWREPPDFLRHAHTDDRDEMRALVAELTELGRLAVGYRRLAGGSWCPCYTSGDVVYPG